jgi:hypothetical protein
MKALVSQNERAHMRYELCLDDRGDVRLAGTRSNRCSDDLRRIHHGRRYRAMLQLDYLSTHKQAMRQDVMRELPMTMMEARNLVSILQTPRSTTPSRQCARECGLRQARFPILPPRSLKPKSATNAMGGDIFKSEHNGGERLNFPALQEPPWKSPPGLQSPIGRRL